MEKHCQELEKKVEFVFLNQKFYEEIVDDFIYFKKLADISSDIGGYFDPYAPTERYDNRINKKVHYDQNGIINLRQLSEEHRSDETTKIKKLQHELDILKSKYFSLKQDFELMVLNNNELKSTIYSLQGKKGSNSNDDDITNELKEENKSLSRKIEILIEKINVLQEEANNSVKKSFEFTNVRNEELFYQGNIFFNLRFW
jgi:hypothetical protein